MSANLNAIMAVFTLGRYYNPAKSHYPDREVSVVCDRCGAADLLVSLGHEDNDVCMACAAQLEAAELRKCDSTVHTEALVAAPMMVGEYRPRTRMRPASYASRALTRMRPSGYATRMAPEDYRAATRMAPEDYRAATRMAPEDYRPLTLMRPTDYAAVPARPAHDVNAVFARGQYYNPAWKHYGREISVVCDRCNKANLLVCVGLDSTDVCMECMAQLDAAEKRLRSAATSAEAARAKLAETAWAPTAMMAGEYRPSQRLLTKMKVSDYRIPDRGPLVSLMMVSDYRPPIAAPPAPAPFTAEAALETFRKGVFYNPAWKHYGRDVSVVCDRCGKSNLLVSIGLDNFDICLTCAAALEAAEAALHPAPPVPSPAPSAPVFRMAPSDYRN